MWSCRGSTREGQKAEKEDTGVGEAPEGLVESRKQAGLFDFSGWSCTETVTPS